MAGFKELQVWQKGITLTTGIYEPCKQLPAEEKFGLSSQLKRAAVLVPSNIAEGYRRSSRKEFKQLCGIALGSCAELETQLIITSEVYENIDTQELLLACEEVQKMLNALSRKL